VSHCMYRSLPRLGLLLFGAVIAFQPAAAVAQPERARTATEPSKKPSEPLRFPADRPIDIKHIALDLRVDVPKKHVAGAAAIDLVALREATSIRFDAVDFDVASVTLARNDGAAAPVNFINDGQAIDVLIGGNPLPAGGTARLRIEYSITNPKSGLHFFAPSEAEPDVPYALWSQGESIDNRYWVPCFDHPNEMQTTEMTVTTAAGNEVISNGRLVSKKTDKPGAVTFHWLQDKPHVAYLMTLVVGEFHVEQETWRGKPVTYYVPQKHRADVKRSFGNTVEMLEHFSTIIGVEYPWDKYAQVCVEQYGGGMENTSATTLGPGTLHDERAHLDFSSDGLVAHELAHQWFGDLVTCKDWSHLWLNEGFATYFSAVWDEHDLGRDEYDYSISQNMERAIEGGKDRPVVDRGYENPGDMFDSRSYPKGSAILHMLRHRVGDAMFWGAVKRYLTAHAHQPVETSDFRQALEAQTGRSLERFFHDWTERPGAPKVDVTYEWMEKDKLAQIVVRQTQEAEVFHFPIEVEFHVDGAPPTYFREDISDKDRTLFVPLTMNPTMVLVDPNCAVLMELKERKPRDLWAAQLRNDPHAVGRIRAARHLAESGKDRDIHLLGEALQTERYWGVGVEIAEAVGKAGGEVARDVLLSGLLVEHPKVRRACAAQLGSFHGDAKVAEALYALIRDGDPSYRVESAAIESYARIQPDGAIPFLTSLLNRDSHREQIRSAVLTGLGNQPTAAGLDVLMEWTRRGKPRECRQAALSALGSLTRNVHLEEADTVRVVDALVTGMKGEHRRIQQAAIVSLRELGKESRPALPELRALAANDPDSRIRKAAETAVEKITAAAPEQVQVKELRDELDKFRKQTKELEDRLQKLEGRSKKETMEENPSGEREKVD